MLAQADFQRALALALGEFAEAWTIVGECAPVDRVDASHWGSGPQSFQVTLRHRVTGHLKVLGRRVTYEPGASVHPAVALSLIGAYRHGNAEPIRRYFEEIGVAAVTAADATHFSSRPAAAPSSHASADEPLEVLASGYAVGAAMSEPRAASSVSEIDETDAAQRSTQRTAASRPWNLGLRKPKRPPAVGGQAPPEIRPAPAIRRSLRVPRESKRERRCSVGSDASFRSGTGVGAGSGQDKEKWHARD
jgi:hypothetical protein